MTSNPQILTPELSVLNEPQTKLWGDFEQVPARFVLYGGTAVALQLGHRTSVDFAFFGSHSFDPDELYGSIDFLRKSKIIQKSSNTLSCIVDRGGPVQVSFFGVPSLRQICDPTAAADNGLKIASMLDLAGTKAAVVQKRAEAKDYLDIDAILRLTEVDLPDALSAGKMIYGDSFVPEITLKALSYFGDGNLATLPRDVQDRLAKAVASVDLAHLPKIGRPH